MASAPRSPRTLNRLDTEAERVTAKAVERRLAHLRRRLEIGGDDPAGLSAAGLEGARRRPPARRIVTRGYGETVPVAPNTNPDGSDNPAGRAENRRVVITAEGI